MLTITYRIEQDEEWLFNIDISHNQIDEPETYSYRAQLHLLLISRNNEPAFLPLS